MAINKDVKTQYTILQDLWSRYNNRFYIFVTVVQYAFFLIGYGVLVIIGTLNVDWLAYFGLSFISTVFLSAITITLIHLQGKPLNKLIRAISPTPSSSNYIDLQVKSSDQSDNSVIDSHPQQSTARTGIVYEGVENMLSGLVILGKDNQVLYSNNGAHTTEDMHGKTMLDLLFPEADSLENWIEKVRKNKLKAHKNWTRITNKLHSNKDRKIFDVSASFHKGSTAEIILTLFDRTSDYAPEEDDLDFISFAAHELRGPITVIRGYLDVLQDELDPKLDEDQKELMNRLIVSTNRLTSYVNNILNTSRYDRRHLKLRLSEEKVRDIYELIADDMQMRASTQNRMLVIDIPYTLPTIAADTNAVGEVMSNLIDNAIKYSNEGGLVHVTAKATSNFIEVSVIDRGIGMPENVIPNLFHKFYRSHRSRETVSGTGIGLYICKAIINSHGGTITARSIENEGSTFSFTLPIYDTVAEKISTHNNSNESLIEHGSGWIRNHSMYRG